MTKIQFKHALIIDPAYKGPVSHHKQGPKGSRPKNRADIRRIMRNRGAKRTLPI